MEVFRKCLSALALGFGVLFSGFVSQEAVGSVTLELGDMQLSGGQKKTWTFKVVQTGPTTNLIFSGFFVNLTNNPSCQFGDVVLQTKTANGINVWWGGSNYSIPGATWLGTWSFLNMSSANGFYQDVNNSYFIVGGMTGTLEVSIICGWSNSPLVEYQDVVVTIQGDVFLAFAPSDLNSDGLVNGADLGILLSHWGSANPAADVNDDGIVNGADIGVLLAEWTG
jgi:hypothetical protein